MAKVSRVGYRWKVLETGPGTKSIIFEVKHSWVWVQDLPFTSSVCTCMLSHFSSVGLSLTLWTVACLAPLSMRFSRQEYWSWLPFSLPGDLSNSGIEPRSSALQADCLLYEPPEKPNNTGVGSLSLLQGIFLTQELNWVSSTEGEFFTS